MMGFLFFVVIFIVSCTLIKKAYVQKKEQDESNAAWRMRQNLESEKRHIEDCVTKLMDEERINAVRISERLRKEIEPIIFKTKCFKYTDDILNDSKSFCDIELDEIDGIKFYKSKWQEYENLISDENKEFANIHAEIKEKALNKVKNDIILELQRKWEVDEMIGKAFNLNLIYGKLCVLIAATNTEKYNELMRNFREYLDTIFSCNLILVKELEYGKFELSLDNPEEMLYVEQHINELKVEIRKKLENVTDNENDDFKGMFQVFNLEFLKKMATLMWYYAKKKPFNSDEFFEACKYFDEFTAHVCLNPERMIAEIYAKNQIGGSDLVNQDISKFNKMVYKTDSNNTNPLHNDTIVSALAWMELYDLEFAVLKDMVKNNETLSEIMQERLSFLSDGGTTNLKIYNVDSTDEFLYFDSSSAEWTSKEFDIFFKKLSMKNIALNYSLAIDIWKKTIPLVSGKKINENDIYKEFDKMTEDFDGEVTISKVKAKAIDVENMVYNEAVLFDFNSERNRCMSMIFYCEKFGRNLNLIVITIFKSKNNLSVDEMKKYAHSIKQNIYVGSFRESILQSIDEVLKDRIQVYEENDKKKLFE